MMWQVPKIWEGGDVWILGGGPSLTRMFGIPQKLVNEVVKGVPPSVYSPYMSLLHDKHVLAVNMSYRIGSWIDMVFFGDNSFFLREKRELAAFPGIKVTCHPLCEKYNWVKFCGRDTNHPRGISPNPKMVSWNSNSGSATISLAAHLGARRIMLLGFDMKLGSDGMQHWHDLYHRVEERRNYNPKDPANFRKVHETPFDRHLVGFAEMEQDAKNMRIQILNITDDSAIPYFRKLTFKQFVEENPSYIKSENLIENTA